MSPPLLEALHDQYEGRVFAFDHFTLAHDPKRNVAELARMVPDGTQLDLDIICHSRGGLVARVMAERPPDEFSGSRSLDVRRVVFVATPNAGTVLADGNYMGDFVNRYTTLLNLFPDNGITEVLETIITVVKQLAVGSLNGLDGLASMRPGGAFLKDWLNNDGAPGSEYFALESNYEPTNAGLLAFARDRLTDRIFADADNDLVVPTEGVHAANGSARFPITSVEAFAAADAVPHSGFFGSSRTADRLRTWLAF
jgi:pimeloyl-ACP methyl ester carboxylesterase